MERFVDGMKDKLEEATVQLSRLKAQHGKRDDELGERNALTANSALLAKSGCK